jgi:hypothetical protein
VFPLKWTLNIEWSAEVVTEDRVVCVCRMEGYESCWGTCLDVVPYALTVPERKTGRQVAVT